MTQRPNQTNFIDTARDYPAPPPPPPINLNGDLRGPDACYLPPSALTPVELRLVAHMEAVNERLLAEMTDGDYSHLPDVPADVDARTRAALGLPPRADPPFSDDGFPTTRLLRDAMETETTRNDAIYRTPLDIIEQIRVELTAGQGDDTDALRQELQRLTGPTVTPLNPRATLLADEDAVIRAALADGSYHEIERPRRVDTRRGVYPLADTPAVPRSATDSPVPPPQGVPDAYKPTGRYQASPAIVDDLTTRYVEGLPHTSVADLPGRHPHLLAQALRDELEPLDRAELAAGDDARWFRDLFADWRVYLALIVCGAVIAAAAVWGHG